MSLPIITSSTATIDQAITDIIESVALEEAALSHILNAEGEKMQKIITLPQVTTNEIMKVNKSIQSMVNVISRLEMILKFKLDMVICQNI